MVPCYAHTVETRVQIPLPLSLLSRCDNELQSIHSIPNVLGRNNTWIRGGGRLIFRTICGSGVKVAAGDLKSPGGDSVRVRIPPPARMSTRIGICTRLRTVVLRVQVPPHVLEKRTRLRHMKQGDGTRVVISKNLTVI